MSDLRGLIERVERTRETNNRLDCEIDIALFKPDRYFSSVRMNAAGTKLVYTRRDGSTATFWSCDHTLTADSRTKALALLRALDKGVGNG